MSDLWKKIRALTALAAVATSLATFSPQAVAAEEHRSFTLRNGDPATEDGAVELTVDGAGAFGSSAAPGGLVTYNPKGSVGAASIVYESAVYFSPEDRFLSAGGSLDGPPVGPIRVLSASESSVTTEFTVGPFLIRVNQTLHPIGQYGSVLTQTYSLINQGNSMANATLVRHVDGDLYFDGTLSDGGGADADGARLFQFDSSDDPRSPTTFVGIQDGLGAPDSWTLQPYRYTDDIRASRGLPAAHSGRVAGDVDGDRIIDQPYDVTMSQERRLVLPPQSPVQYVTHTLFGEESPAGTQQAGRVILGALGDSYSSGEGVEPYDAETDLHAAFAPDLGVSNRCHRSSQAYARRLSSDVRFHAACSGAVIADYWSSNRKNLNEPAQRTWLSSATTLVTTTLGGNDVGFEEVLKACVLATFKTCEDQYHDNGVDRISTAIARTAVQLKKVYEDMVSQAQNATIFVLGYPQIIASNAPTCGQAFMYRSDMLWLREKWTEMNQAIRAMVGTTKGNIHFVNVENAFSGHELCTSDPWVIGLDPVHQERSFHPNAAGHCQLAKAIDRRVSC